jgi:hypothetical protein
MLPTQMCLIFIPVLFSLEKWYNKVLYILFMHHVYMYWECSKSNEIMNRPSCEVVLESSQSVTVVTVSVKEDERGGQGHTSKSLLHHLSCDTTL